MAISDFFTDEAKTRVRDAVVRVESQTSAELVVAVRRKSGNYRDADWLAGALSGFVVLLLVLFLPVDFAVTTMPVDVLMGFGLGAVISSRSTGWKRWLSSRATREATVQGAASAAFLQLGVGRTSGRNGILVLVSTLERRAEVVFDVGIDPKQLGDGWSSALSAMNSAVEQGAFDAFVQGMEALGPVLGKAMPRREDDVNELPDEVRA